MHVSGDRASNALGLHRLLNKIRGFLPARIGSPTFGLLSHQYNQALQRRIVRAAGDRTPD